MFLYNDPKLKQRRKDLRHKETPYEQLLWCNLRGKKLGYKFTRQYSVGPYILDFNCVEKKLGIELDGLQHLQNKGYDKERDLYLEFHSVKVVRFWNAEISDSMDTVLSEITRHLNSSSPYVGGGQVGVSLTTTDYYMTVTLKGNEIKSKSDFHSQMRILLDLPIYYGENLSALWDCLTSWVSMPLTLVWEDFDVSKKVLGEFADDAMVVFKRAEKQVTGFKIEIR